jgi:broad specificity phosphatase PhoE
MSLLLVRHGQARAGTDDYDRLSDLGTQQALRLGAWLAGSGHAVDGVLVGGMRRHRQTFDALARGYAGAGGGSLPEPVVDTGWDEFDHHAVFDGFVRAHPTHEAVVGSKAGGLQALGALIHAALSAWSEDRIGDVPETWAAFGQRVAAAGAAQPGRVPQNALVVTSGGVISRLAQSVLGASDRAAVDLNLSLRNSAVCEFHVRPYGLALGSWNTIPHLHDRRELWTYY